MPTLGRLITAMVTPFDQEGRVDVAQACALAQALVASGSDGVIVSGTTGESATLTHDEEMRLFKAVRSALGDTGSLVAGTGSNSTATAVEMTQAAESVGADGVLLVVPYYNKPTQEGLYQHFKAIAESTRLPCMLYNVPGRTATNMLPETVARLSEIHNIVGIKEASGDLEQIGRIIDLVEREDFHVWSGNDNDTLAVIQRGGYGVVSVSSHLVGRQMKEMIELALRGENESAVAIHDHLTPLFRDLFLISNPIPVKYALNQVGFRVGGLRLPMTPPDEESAKKIMATVSKYTIDLPLPAGAASV